MDSVDVLIVGGGIVGLATGMALVETRRLAVAVVEAEGEVARHQTGHNSGVIHSGLYYKPGSAKARNCAEGRELMYRFCADNGISADGQLEGPFDWSKRMPAKYKDAVPKVVERPDGAIAWRLDYEGVYNEMVVGCTLYCVADYEDFPGRIEAVNMVDVRARVTGYLAAMKFKEGADVQKGDVLFEIEPGWNRIQEIIDAQPDHGQAHAAGQVSLP